MDEPYNRTERLLEESLRMQHRTLQALDKIRNYVTSIAVIVLLAFLLHFMGCPAMEAARQERYQSLGHLAIPSQLLPP